MTILTLAGRLARKARDGYDVSLYHALGATAVDVVADVLIANGALTIAAQPTYPSKLRFTVTDGDASITALDVDIVGVDNTGAAASETVSLDNGGAGGSIVVQSTKLYTSVTSLTLKNATGNGAGDNVSVGTAPVGNEDFTVPRAGIWAGGDSPVADVWIERGSLRELQVAGHAVGGASDALGVAVEESSDGVNVDHTPGAVTSDSDEYVRMTVRLTAPYFRFKWDNAATAMTTFDVEVVGRAVVTPESALGDDSTDSQNALSTSEEVILAARADRKRAIIKNLDAAITVYVGPTGVTSGNGTEIKAGESTAIYSRGVLYGIAASGTPTISVHEEFN